MELRHYSNTKLAWFRNVLAREGVGVVGVEELRQAARRYQASCVHFLLGCTEPARQILNSCT
eukprot:11669-Amphidinium_carterae.1